MAEDHRGCRKLDGVHGGPERRVGQVNGHPQCVHSVNNLDSEVAEAVVVPFVRTVADVVLAEIGETIQHLLRKLADQAK